IIRAYPDIHFLHDEMMMISPDEGAIYRAMYYASVLGIPLGTFYKRRDYTVIKNGRNPIIAHEFLGQPVDGRDVIIVDDMISSGESMLEIAKTLKASKARKIFCVATFGLFTDGLELFDKAYEEGIVDAVFCTNLIYRSPEVLAAPWYRDVSVSRFLALIIDALNHNASLSSLLDPTTKIRTLLRAIGNDGKKD
ncbi:MAG: phosphoribosyltransferase family protein, partial [Saccharofermentanales bacterium]